MAELVSIIALIIGILFFIGIFFNEESYVFLAEKILLIFFFASLVIGIIVFVPWLLIIGIVIVGFIYFINKKNNVIDKNSNVNQNSNNDTLSLTCNQEPSDFQHQLLESTKTPQQVEEENWLKEKETIKNRANYDFSSIKRALLDKAQKGQYTVMNNHKCITFNYDCSYLLSCVDRQYSRNYTGKVGTPGFKLDEKVYYHIINEKQFTLYLSTIKGLALQDNINISTFFAEINLARHRKNRIALPYTFTGGDGMGVSSHKIKVYLECSIRY